MKAITNTFVTVATDCSVTSSVVPVAKGGSLPVHVVQFELLTAQPYQFTLEDLIFETHVRRQGLSKAETKARAAEIRSELFRKSHACMRASALPKKYGWGVHYDAKGRLALYAVDSEEYQRFAKGRVEGVKVEAALRSKRA